jgi:cytochrome P450
LRDWIGSKVAETEEKGRPVPLLDALQKRFEIHGRKAQQTAVTAEYALLLIGGIETTAAALTFAVVELANNEDIRKKASEEANKPTAPSIISGPMVHVFQETLRRHTIARAFARQAGPDEEIGSTAIPKGADYQFFPAKYHMDKTVWNDPKTFNPARFEDLNAAQKQSYLPYSAGPMICLGRHLAQAEGVVIMTSFLQHLTTEGIGTLGYVRKNISATQRPEDAKVRVCPFHWLHNSVPK